jgi:hypothetical protein
MAFGPLLIERAPTLRSGGYIVDFWGLGFDVFASDQKVSVPHYDIKVQMDWLRTLFGQEQRECPEILKALDTCPSLLAGQGSALAMLAAYVLAGELKKAAVDHRIAFRNYELLLRDFVDKKQRVAERCSRSLAPNTRFGIFARNRATDLMSLPIVARLALGPLLTDSLALPSYDSP